MSILLDVFPGPEPVIHYKCNYVNIFEHCHVVVIKQYFLFINFRQHLYV